LLHSIVDKGPIARATVAEANGVYDKLTNTALYTGSHKQRFDESGVGKGAAGRQPIDSGTNELSKITNRTTNHTVAHNTYSGSSTNISNSASGGLAKKRGQTAVVTASVETLDVKAQKPKRVDAHASNRSLNQSSKDVSMSSGSLSGGSKTNLSKSNTKSTSSINKPTSGYSTKQAGASVFDRLTNVSGYTGSHKERFNADGSGKGISGRDAPAKGGAPGTYRGGDVKDLSQILRT